MGRLNDIYKWSATPDNMGNAIIDFSIFMAITVVEGKLYCFVLVCDVVFCLYVGGATIGSFVSTFSKPSSLSLAQAGN